MKEIGRLIIIITLCISFFVNSILLVSEGTRRTAEELKVVNEIKSQEKESKHNRLLSEAELCVESGGRPEFSNTGDSTDCKRN